jgi:hypothetical protein
MPDGFNARDYGNVDLGESIEVSLHPVDGISVAPAVRIAKTGGPFLVTLTNGGAVGTGTLEMYFRFH